MARYDLSVSPHSLATFTNSTGFPAKLENSTRRPDSAVAWISCSCIDAGAVVFSLIIKRECPASAALPKCAYRAFALRRNEYARMGAPTQLIYFQKNCQTTPCRRPTLGRARASYGVAHTSTAGRQGVFVPYSMVPTPLPHEYTHFSSFRLKVTKFGSRADRRVDRVD